MSNLNQIGYHFVGGFSEAECNEYFGLLNDTRPACINVKGAEQYPQALEFAKTCAKVYPGTRVIFRHMIPGFNFPGEDTGRWTKVAPRDWWTYIGSQYKNSGLTILLSNEDTMDDYSLYDSWLADCMTRAGDEGVAVAFARFPTHHPRPGKEQHFDKTLKAAFKYKIHTYSPNIYWSEDNPDGFKYALSMVAYAERLGIPLDTTIGEFARLKDIRDAYNGWRRCGISGKEFALDAVFKARTHLKGIPVSIYSVGKWPLGTDEKGQSKDTFSLDNEARETLKNNLTPLNTLPAPETPPAPVPVPPVVIVEPPKPAPDTTALPTEHVETLRAWLAGEIAKLEADAVEHQKIADAKRALANEKKALKAILDMALSKVAA